MDQYGSEVKRLLEQTARVRQQFLEVEAETCLTALDNGRLQLSRGHVEAARMEIAFVEKGLRDLERFAAELPDQGRERWAGRRAEIRAQLEALKRS